MANKKSNSAERLMCLMVKYPALAEYISNGWLALYNDLIACRGDWDNLETVCKMALLDASEWLEKQGLSAVLDPTRKAWFIENSLELTNTLEKIKETFPCWVDRDLIEMDMSYVKVEARVEDIPAIERMLAPLM